MSGKMRVSLHNGRGSSKHNDRSFLKNWTDDEIKEKAPHIDTKKMNYNYYWATEQADKKRSHGATFEEIELSYYDKFFSKALNETNQNYVRQGHSERVKTMEDWYKSKQKAPFESILQLGDMNSNINPNTFRKMCLDYVNHINKKYGKNIRILNFAIHFDEASPHMHLRQTYVYQDGETLKIGQNKALEQLGIELPNPKAKASRKNNRKMTLDKQLRAKWQEIAKSYGYDIETKPRANIKHKEKEEFINDQIAKQEEIFKLNDSILKKHSVQEDKEDKKGILGLPGKVGYELIKTDELKALRLNNERVKALDKELKAIKDNPNKILQEAYATRNKVRMECIHERSEIDKRLSALKDKEQAFAEKILKYGNKELEANTLDLLKSKYPKQMETMIKSVKSVEKRNSSSSGKTPKKAKDYEKSVFDDIEKLTSDDNR